MVAGLSRLEETDMMVKEDVWLKEGFREPYQESFDPYFYICGGRYTKDEVEKMTFTEFGVRRAGSMPRKLYKYFPNIKSGEENYSLQALKNGTVFLQEAKEFDDNYDCILTMNEEQFARIRIEHYASLCGIHIEDDWDYGKCATVFVEFICSNCKTIDDVRNIFKNNNSDSMLDKNCELFVLRIENTLLKHINKSDLWQQAFYESIHSEYMNMLNVTKKFRIACFTTSPYMINMWSSYADKHKGFCIEYKMPDSLCSGDILWTNLFPVIYSDARCSSLQKCMEELDSMPNEDYLATIYKFGILAKSKTLWKEQNEWRLVSLDDMLAEDYNCKFYPISKVYLGQKMQSAQRKQIIDICKSMKIPYIGVVQSNEQYRMKECNVLCEVCDRMKNSSD